MSIKIYDDIVLFGRKTFEWDSENREYTENVERIDFYVSDANNKNTLETGKNWATTTNWVNKKSITVEPLVIHTKNNGFKLSLDSSADYSSQGGKLSFWMCKIEKDNICGRIGINQEELNQLFKESTFINGVCQQEVCFYRIGGQVGACVVGGERYKEFYNIKDKDTQLSKAKKTTKWELGRVYESKTMRSVWVGVITDIKTGNKFNWILDVYKDNRIDVSRVYDTNLRGIINGNTFPSRVASDVVIDVSNISQRLANKIVSELKQDIQSAIKYIDDSDEQYFYWNEYDLEHLANYYINFEDYPKDIVIDYCYIMYYALECYYNRYGKLGREKVAEKRITEMLNILGANTNYTQIDFETIIDKYREE